MQHVWRRVEVYTEFFVGKFEGKRPSERPGRRWEDNIKMDLQEVGWEGTERIDLAQDRDRWRALVNAVHKMRGISRLAENRLASQGLCSMK